MLRLAGLQDGVEVYPAVGQVLTHAEEEAVQVVTQLDRLRGGKIGKVSLVMKLRACDATESELTALCLGLAPDSEVGENQLTSRESYPVNTPASVEQNESELEILL